MRLLRYTNIKTGKESVVNLELVAIYESISVDDDNPVTRLQLNNGALDVPLTIDKIFSKAASQRRKNDFEVSD